MAETTWPGRIFMSYRREDTAMAAGWLYDRLRERFGASQIFKDVDTIRPGEDFVREAQLRRRVLRRTANDLQFWRLAPSYRGSRG